MTNRHTSILEALTKNQVTALGVRFRKDLEEWGRIRGFSPEDVGMRLAYHYNLKRRIAVMATEAVEDGETVMLESGSCCALLAEELAAAKRDITIITNSAFIANHIRSYGKTVLLGGDYQRESQVTVGPITRKCAEGFFADKFFIGADGFTEGFGFTGKDHLRAQTVQELAGLARQVLVLTESEKFRNRGAAGLVKTEQVQVLYTDDKIPSALETYLTGKNLIIHKVCSDK